jgi:hypothetical protein
MKFHFKTPCDYLTAIKEFRKTPENCQKFPKLPHSIEWKVKKKFHSFLFYILFGSTRHQSKWWMVRLLINFLNNDLIVKN